METGQATNPLCHLFACMALKTGLSSSAARQPGHRIEHAQVIPLIRPDGRDTLTMKNTLLLLLGLGVVENVFAACIIDYSGDGDCDIDNNVEECSYDDGDCCSCDCTDTIDYECGFSGYDCVNPDSACFGGQDPAPAPIVWITQTPTEGAINRAACITERTGDGYCDDDNNVGECGYDDGDCCSCDCIDGDYYDCGSDGFTCVNPDSACYGEHELTPPPTARITPAPTEGCDEGLQGDADGVQVCCPGICDGVCDNDGGCDLDPSCCPSSIANSGVYCDTDGISPPCLVGSSATSLDSTPACSGEQEPTYTRTESVAISAAVFGVALIALFLRSGRRKKRESRGKKPTLVEALLDDEYRSAHVVVSCVELALSALNALEQNALELGSATKLVFAASAIMEFAGFGFAMWMATNTEHAGGIPILCIWEAHYNDSKWKSVRKILMETPSDQGSKWVREWIDPVSKSESEDLWRKLLLWGVGPQVLCYWVLAGLNALFFAPDGSTSVSLVEPNSWSIYAFSWPEDVTSLSGVLFFGVILYAIVMGSLVGMYRCGRDHGLCGSRHRDEFFVVYYSVYALLIAVELAESFLIFFGLPASPASYMLACLDLFLTVPAVFFIFKRMMSKPVEVVGPQQMIGSFRSF